MFSIPDASGPMQKSDARVGFDHSSDIVAGAIKRASPG
jgi:hypothetical protein